jgi:hypothetical protein
MPNVDDREKSQVDIRGVESVLSLRRCDNSVPDDEGQRVYSIRSESISSILCLRKNSSSNPQISRKGMDKN